jgi:SAM-dependent methyltransferase
LAVEEDRYFAGHPLFEADRRALDERFSDPGPLVDLGCGAGRHAVRFARRGFPVVAVDLSGAMLRVVGEKAMAEGLDIRRVRANLCELGCFPDRSFAYALSMFSTLGMIRTPEARRRALSETFRILRPGGRLAFHAHNLWLNLRNPEGRKWLIGQLALIVAGRNNAGDRRMTYRGVPGMEVHLYRWGELKRDLRAAGFRIEEVLAIDTESAEPIAAPWLFGRFRVGGWLIFARRPGAAA